MREEDLCFYLQAVIPQDHCCINIGDDGQLITNHWDYEEL